MFSLDSFFPPIPTQNGGKSILISRQQHLGSSMQDTAAEEREEGREEIWTFLVSTQWDWT